MDALQPAGQTCSGCTVIVGNLIWNLKKSGDHKRILGRLYRSLAFLARSASIGCSLCRIILDAIENSSKTRLHEFLSSSERHDADVMISAKGFVGASAEQHYTGLQVWLQKAENTQTGKDVGLLIADLCCWLSGDINPFRHSLFEAAGLATDHRNPKCLELAKQWYRTCWYTHGNCPHSHGPLGWGQPTLLPKRVIVVGDEDHDPYLLIPENGLRGRYACLSYCWGRGQTYTTKMSTLSLRTRGMPLNELPNTIRDAIILTRELGIKYIWIDALCIIQDSYEDWKEQASKMTDIYMCSVLTIAPAATSSVSEGFLHTRPTVSSYTSIRNAELSAELLLARLPDSYQSAVECESLDRRGWTLQEKLISPRVLYYSRQQMFWSCNTFQRYEQGPFMQEIVPDQYDPAQGHSITETRRMNLHINLLFPRPGNGKQIMRLYDEWYKIVLEYSNRALTNPTDKLPAIAGLAKFFKQQSPTDTYLAGLWLKDLHRGLTWRVGVSGIMEKPDCQTPRAPTWSWARLDGRLKTFDCLKRFFEPDKEEFGIPGWETTFQVRTPKAEYVEDFIGEDRRIRLLMTGWAEYIEATSETRLNDIGDQSKIPGVWRGIWSYYFDERGEPDPQTCLRMIVGRWGTWKDGKITYSIIVALLLKPVEGGESENLFRRVGVGSVWSPPLDADTLRGKRESVVII